MKNKLEVFFDYTCPYCLRGHELLKELMPEHPEIEIIWRPCEAHPRPEQYGRHSDLCVRALLFALETGADIWTFHETMYRAAQKEHIDIEDPAALAGYMAGLVDKEALLTVLIGDGNGYAGRVDECNSLAYDKNGVWAVPSFRMNGEKLDAVEGVGVTKAALTEFLGRTK